MLFHLIWAAYFRITFQFRANPRISFFVFLLLEKKNNTQNLGQGSNNRELFSFLRLRLNRARTRLLAPKSACSLLSAIGYVGGATVLTMDWQSAWSNSWDNILEPCGGYVVLRIFGSLSGLWFLFFSKTNGSNYVIFSMHIMYALCKKCISNGSEIHAKKPNTR